METIKPREFPIEESEIEKELCSEIEQLRAALLSCARQAEALKRDCGMDPESPQAIRNAQYQSISTAAHIALGTIRGPQTDLSADLALERERTKSLLETAGLLKQEPTKEAPGERLYGGALGGGKRGKIVVIDPDPPITGHIVFDDEVKP